MTEYNFENNKEWNLKSEKNEELWLKLRYLRRFTGQDFFLVKAIIHENN